jgi:hypothetical protein
MVTTHATTLATRQRAMVVIANRKNKLLTVEGRLICVSRSSTFYSKSIARFSKNQFVGLHLIFFLM